jgi:N-acetylglucosaminyl-diphospho-decaprenol L-rhamnosyltransferase
MSAPHPAQHTDLPAAQRAAVTVSVVSHGHLPMVALLLQDLVRARCDIAEVILTLNTAADCAADTSALAPGAAWPLTVLRNPQSLGFGANHNQAFAHSSTPWFAVVNPDIRLPAGAAANALSDPFAPLLNAPGAAALRAPRVLSPQGGVEDSWRQTVTPWRLLVRVAGVRRAAASAQTDWAAGMFLLLRADAYAAVGGFDERMHMYCEDMDLCLRLRDAGHSIALVADAQVVHDAQRASRKSAQHLRWHLGSLGRFWLSRARLLPRWHRSFA